MKSINLTKSGQESDQGSNMKLADIAWKRWDKLHEGHNQYFGKGQKIEWKGCIDCNDQIQQPKEEKMKRYFIKLFLFLAVIALIGLLLTSCGGQSLSYKDGYVFGKSEVEGNPYITPPTPAEMCTGVTLPPGDNEQQWYQGCVDGYNASFHPGS